MNRKKETTILVLGDRSDYDAYLKFKNELGKFQTPAFNYAMTTYERLESGRLPKIKSDSVIVFPFFPFHYWDKNIETHRYRGVYGNEEFYNKFRVFWSRIYEKLNHFYGPERLSYINHPTRIASARDKVLSKTAMRDEGVNVTHEVFARNNREILKLINDEGKRLFIKVRYGSMGKGIAYLERGRWMTNFRYRSGRIVSLHSDHGWSFIDVTDNKEFLKKLLSKDIIIEEAVDPHRVDGLIYDLRFYVCCGQVIYIYPRTNAAESITTNISQGGIGKNSRFLRRLPKRIIKEAERSAIKAAGAVGLKFAGVDIMPDARLKNAYVIEINAFPGFPKAKKFNLSKRILKRIAIYFLG